MSKKIAIQRMGQTMKEGTVIRWLKNNGDAVKAGDSLYEMEYDKASTDITAPIDGTLQIIEEAGGTFPVGTVVGMIYAEGEKVAQQPAATAPMKAQEAVISAPVEQTAEKRAYKASASVKRAARQKNIDLAMVVPADGVRITEKDLEDFEAKGKEAVTSETPKINASPLAKKMARKLGIDLADVTASSANGRISSEDVVAFASAGESDAPQQPAATETLQDAAETLQEDRRVPLSGMRKAITRNMKASYFGAPVVTYSTDIDMTQFLAMRSDLNSEYEQQGIKVSVNDLLIKAVAKALEKSPNINVSLENEETLVYRSQVNVGMAVAVDGGLVVPVVKDANKKTPGEIARCTKELVEKARTGKLSGDEMSGGTFTVSNLGSKGVDMFTPIISPPESAILGIGRAVEKAVVCNGEIAVKPMMVISLTADHRVIDGAPAADFMQVLKTIVEKPALMFV
ncbi:MAG: dihydrolipoamide acetyltransferase family protein [Christensenella sp.]|nr:dihydrolipoamide acetyltransferase family protein [Christensenella sp.]